MNQSQRLLTVPEFAETLKVTRSCIRRWISERRITTVKIGRCVRIPEAETTRIIESGLRPARSAKPAEKETR
jgi:excisionase family DNA binding protein